MLNQSPEGPPNNSYHHLHNLRRWILTEASAGKKPAARWRHPRADEVGPGQGRLTVDQRNFHVTSNTPSTWLTYDEASAKTREISTDERRIVPAYVHSVKVDRPQDDCGGFIFLDLDNGTGDDPEGKGIAFFDTLVSAFLARWPDALRVRTVSGDPRQHILCIFDPADRDLWTLDGKQTRVAEGAPEWKVEWWNPFGGGRYRCFTNDWLGDKPADDHRLPVISHAELTDFFANDLAGLWVYDKATQERKRQAEGKARGPGRPPGVSSAAIPYPGNVAYQKAEFGAAFRIARYMAEKEMPITRLDDGTLYIALETGVLAPLDDSPASKGNTRLAAVRYAADIAAGEEMVDTCESEDDREAMKAHQSDFLHWCRERPGQFNVSVQASIHAFALNPGYKGLLRQGKGLVSEESELEAPLTQLDLNSVPRGESHFALADGNVYGTRNQAHLNPSECYAGLRTTDAPTLRELWVPGAYQPDPALCDSEGQRYAALLLRAWGPSWPLLVWLTIKPRKANSVGVLVSEFINRGKSTLPDILQKVGLARVQNDAPRWLEGIAGPKPRFDYLAKELCHQRLVVFDEFTKPLGEVKGPVQATNLKSLTGATSLDYEVKNAHPVKELRQANMLIIGNKDLLIDLDDPAVEERVFFIPVPAMEPGLDPAQGGMDKEVANDLSCRRAIIDAYFDQVHRVEGDYEPPYIPTTRGVAEGIADRHKQFYADWRSMQASKQKGKSSGEEGM